MNPTKILDILSDFWAKHAPTVLTHVMLFIALRTLVLDPEYLVDGQPIWMAVKQGLERLLNELGFKVERGYVLAVVGLVYLTAVLWAATLLTRLPPFWFYSRAPIDPHIVIRAGTAFRSDPEIFSLRKKLDDSVDAFVRRFVERGKPDPYEWVAAQRQTWLRYYGLFLLATAGAIGWWWSGSAWAKSPKHVAYLGLVTAAAALVARWKAEQKWRYRWRGLQFAMLDAHELESGLPKEPEELRRLRAELLRKSVEIENATFRHPFQIIRTLTYRLPENIRKIVADFLHEHIEYPPNPRLIDWRLLQSQVLRHGEDVQPVPMALKTDVFAERFQGLLECQGAGLCMLVDESTGLAPSVPGGGSRFSFVTRAHETEAPAIQYYRPRSSPESGEISVPNWDGQWGFLCMMGTHPIELLAQKSFPPGGDWWKLTGPDLDTKALNSGMFEGKGTEVCGMHACCRQPMVPGASYVYRSRERGGAEVVIALQCFRVEATEKILLAWKILDIFHDKGEPVPILPWWNPKAWKGIRKKKKARRS